MNKWKRLGLIAGGCVAVAATAHCLNQFVTNAATVYNLTGKRKYHTFAWKFGTIKYTKTGEGSPLLLVHDLKAFSSSYEWDLVIDELSKHYTVYALDLLGCGHSDKPNITYTTYLYTQLISDFVTSVISRNCNCIVTGNSTAMVITAAYTNNKLFNGIMMVNPQSIKKAKLSPDSSAKIRRHLLNCPILGTSIYNMCVSRKAISDYLCDAISEFNHVPNTLIDSYYENAHIQGPSAKYLYTSTECNYTTVSMSKSLSELDINLYLMEGEDMDEGNTVTEYIGTNPAIEVCTIREAKYLPQIENPCEFVKQCKIYLH